ncbi:hypothetical protein [Nostoc sp.]|uniref:hypothetical protein n=1 Tax=Nostoc sp. TaxID=1180 RepID=UPI002FF6449E
MSKFNSNLMRFDCDLIKDFLTADPQWAQREKRDFRSHIEKACTARRNSKFKMTLADIGTEVS